MRARPHLRDTYHIAEKGAPESVLPLLGIEWSGVQSKYSLLFTLFEGSVYLAYATTAL